MPIRLKIIVCAAGPPYVLSGGFELEREGPSVLRELANSLREEVAISFPGVLRDSELCGVVGMGIQLRENPRTYCYSNNTRESAVLFQYTIAGEGRYADDEASLEYDLPAGRAFLSVFPSRTSYWLPEGKTWDLFYTLFVGEPVFRLAEQLLHTHGPVFDMAVDCPALNTLVDVYRRAVKHELEDEYMLSADVYRFFMSLRRMTRYPNADLPEPIADAKRFISDNYADRKLTLSKVAAKAGYSPYHLSRMFKKHTRFSPHEYIVRVRLQHAHELIASTQTPIKQIVGMVGFSDYAHFSNTFKRHFGVTPGSVRRQRKRFGSATVVSSGGCD